MLLRTIKSAWNRTPLVNIYVIDVPESDICPVLPRHTVFGKSEWWLWQPWSQQGLRWKDWEESWSSKQVWYTKWYIDIYFGSFIINNNIDPKFIPLFDWIILSTISFSAEMVSTNVGKSSLGLMISLKTSTGTARGSCRSRSTSRWCAARSLTSSSATTAASSPAATTTILASPRSIDLSTKIRERFHSFQSMH